MIIKHVRDRCIKRNHSNALPRYLLVLDTETMPLACDEDATIWRHEWRLAVAITCRVVGTEFTQQRTHRLSHPDDLIKLLAQYTRERQTLWLIAHNLMFDFIVSQLPTAMEHGLLTLDWPRSKRTKEDGNPDNPHCHSFAVLKNPPTIIGCRLSETQGRIVMLDSRNWFNFSVRELGELVGLPKLEMPPFVARPAAWYQYCQRDAEIVMQAMQQLIKWQRASDFGMFRYTIASQAWSAWRHRFMDRCVYPHGNEFVTRLERASYFGGRTECFRIGSLEEQIYKVDVSSLFPSVMKDNDYPLELLEHEERTHYLQPLASADFSDTIAECEICPRLAAYPKRTNGPTIYPTGTFRTVLAGPELEACRQSGCLVSIGSFARYKMGDLFTRWVREIWNQRIEFEQSGNELFATLAKKLLVSLYGKFAEHGEEWQTRPDIPAVAPWSKWESVDLVNKVNRQFRSFAWHTQEFLGVTEKNNRLVAVAAFVTAYGRLRMNQLRDIVGPENVYYQAVDSLILNKAGLDNLKAAGELAERTLGKLRIQSAAISGHIYGIGDYRIGNECVVAGRSSRAKMIDDNRYQTRKFVGMERLFSGIIQDAVLEQVQTWQRADNYGKGMVGNDGWITPFSAAQLPNSNGTAVTSCLNT